MTAVAVPRPGRQVRPVLLPDQRQAVGRLVRHLRGAGTRGLFVSARGSAREREHRPPTSPLHSPKPPLNWETPKCCWSTSNTRAHGVGVGFTYVDQIEIQL